MELTLFWVGIQQMLLKLLQHPLNNLYVLFVFAFSVDENVIEVHYHENVELLCQDLVDVILKRGRCIGQFKRYDLVLEVAIAGSKGRFLFIAFSDPHLMIGIDQIELDKTLSLT